MNILYLPGYRYPKNLQEPITCGDLRYSFNLSRALARLGHKVQVITRKSAEDDDYAVFDNVEIFRYTSELGKLFSTSFDLSFRRYQLFKELLPQQDLIICNSALSFESFLKIKQPIIYIASGLEDVKNYSFSLRELAGMWAIKLLRDPFKRRTWDMATYVNTTAAYEVQTLRNWGLPEAKISAIGPGVELRRYTPNHNQGELAALRKQLHISNDNQIILSISRFTPAKGLQETLIGFQRLLIDNPKLTMLLVGVQHSHNSNYFREILQLIEERKLGAHVVVSENVSEQELPKYYQLADVFSIFSKGYDPLPTTIIEAMAVGTPVVSTYFKTREQFITDKQTGLFVTEQNIVEWIGAIKNILSNKKLKESISKQGIERVKRNFDIDNIARKYLNLVHNQNE